MLNKFKDLPVRLAIHSFIAVVVSTLIYTSVFSISKFLIVLVIATVIYLAHMEFVNIAQSKGVCYNHNVSIPMYVIWPFVAALLPFSPFSFLILTIVSFLTLLFIFLNTFRTIEGSLNRLSFQVFSHIYITIPLSFLVWILFIDQGFIQQDGRVWLAYLICVAKGSDVGGYFFGSLFGKKPLAAKISPKKTIEGSYGAFLVSILVSIAFYSLTKIFPDLRFSIYFMESILLGLLVSGIAQIGDLSESLLKRDAQIKDSSSMPAVGGILDILDSLIFAAPLLYCYLNLFR